jgi:hypothetical protein
MVVLSIEPCRKSDKAVRTRLFKFKEQGHPQDHHYAGVQGGIQCTSIGT